MRNYLIVFLLCACSLLVGGCAKPRTFDHAQRALDDMRSELAGLREDAGKLEEGDPRREQMLQIAGEHGERLRTMEEAIANVSRYNLFRKESRGFDLYVFSISIFMASDIQRERIESTPGWAHPELNRSPLDRAVSEIVSQAEEIARRARADGRVPRG